MTDRLLRQLSCDEVEAWAERLAARSLYCQDLFFFVGQAIDHDWINRVALPVLFEGLEGLARERDVTNAIVDALEAEDGEALKTAIARARLPRNGGRGHDRDEHAD